VDPTEEDRAFTFYVCPDSPMMSMRRGKLPALESSWETSSSIVHDFKIRAWPVFSHETVSANGNS
jgi:hypothetical protein